MFPLIVFDLDGTLLDTRIDLARSANELLAAYGGAPQPVDAVVRMVGEGVRKLVERAFAAAGLGEPPGGAVPRFLEIYDSHLFEHTMPYKGVPDLLAALAGRHRLALLTNKPAAPSTKLVERFGLAAWFSDVVGGDAALPRKPAPDALLELARRAGVPPQETLMVGDSWIDRETARAAGTATCVARYGFGWEQFPRERLTGDELFIDAPMQLVELVRG